MGDNYFEDWMKSLSKTTRPIYKTGWAVLLEFFKEVKGEDVTPNILLDLLIADRKKPLKDQGEIEQAIKEWINWLESDYGLRQRGVASKSKGKEKIDKKGIGANTIKLYNTAVRGFFSYYGYPLSKKAKLPRHIRMSNGKIENIKIEYRPEKVKTLISVMKSFRDKAIALTMFQSGMDISTTCSLDYGNIKEGFERGDEPLLVHVKRPKVGLNYRTFIGRDAIEAIKVYLNERRNKHGETLSFDRPLFVGEGKNAKKVLRCKSKHFQDNMRKYVVLAGLVSEERLERADFSPARPHALRTGFATIARLKGLNEKLIDYFIGHSDPYGGAYNQATNEELKEKYLEIEPALSVSSVSNFGDIEAQFKGDIDSLEANNVALTSKVLQLEQDFRTLKELVKWEKNLSSRKKL